MQRNAHVGIAVVLAVVGAGFFVGVRGTNGGGSLRTDVPSGVTQVPTARGYGDARLRRYGPNAGMYVGAFEALAPKADLTAQVVQTDEEHTAALAKRKLRRAYDGAPPTIPHRVLQMGPLDCTTCHAGGVQLGALKAPKISHPSFQSCTQCHVVMDDPRPGVLNGAPIVKTENGFAGLPSWGKGSRAWLGAPPTIPHPTLMRGDCASCHGATGTQGIKSTHPRRQSCTQCHVSSAVNDQHGVVP